MKVLDSIWEISGDIRTAGQHVCVVPSNYEMAGQALLGFDMSTTLLSIDDRGAG